MFIVESTRGCPRLPILLYALEELRAGYQLVPRPSGHFLEHHGTIGPALVFGDLTLVQLDAALRLAARAADGLLPSDLAEQARCDSWMELHTATLRPAVARLVRARMAGQPEPDAEQAIARCLDLLERGVTGHSFLVGDVMTLADCPNVIMGGLGRLGVDLSRYSALNAYVDRLQSREAWTRTREVMAGAEAAA